MVPSGHDLVLAGGTAVLAQGPRAADIGVAGGAIAEIGPPGSLRGERTLSVSGMVVMPGGIDPHVHLQQLTASGQTSSDGFRSGSEAALWGGTTTLGDFAYPLPGQRLLDSWKERREAMTAGCRCRCFLHQAFGDEVPDLEAQIDEVMAAGARSFKLHMNDPRVDAGFVERVCRLLAPRGALLMVHAEMGAGIRANVARLRRRGELGVASLPRCQPAALEAEAIDLLLSRVSRFGTRVYIVHLTSERGLDVIRSYRRRGVAVEAETCPQYLLLTEEVYARPGGHRYTCTPPFRTDRDREALWGALAGGEVQTVATDHCPFWAAQKDAGEGDFTRLPMGLPGVENRVPLFVTAARERGFGWELIARLLSTNAAGIFALPGREGIAPGAPADLVVYRPDGVSRLQPAELHMRCDFSPYAGMELRGEVETTMLSGRLWPGDFVG
ncbi:MAG TPA: amidohydrolase family protein [bacterium]|nr:amidohydrolase family protein [bacterium]HPQ66724.1 amidohydrolase family protein [bacterium]